MAKPSPKRHKEVRIIGGIAHNTIVENDKIVEDLGPMKKDQPSEQIDPKIVDSDIQPNNVYSIQEEQEHTSGLQLVSNDDVIIKGYGITPGDIKKSKIHTWEDIQSKIPEPDPDRQDAPQNQKSNIHLTPISTEDLDKILTSDVNKSLKTNVVTNPIGTVKITESVPASEHLKPLEVPILEPLKPSEVSSHESLKPSEVPKVTIPKIKINVPQKDIQSIPYAQPIDTSKLNNIYGTSGNYVYTKPKETEVVGIIPQKADEGIKLQQPKTNIEKSKIKEKRRFMVEDGLEAELLDERRFEEWLKKQKFRENLEKAARFAEETKSQFEEKIPELSEKIEGITGEVKGVEDRLGTMDKSVGELCTGVDCIKTDVKKYQESQEVLQKRYQASQEALEKMVQERFQELGEKVQSLENPTFTCENCGQPVIAPLSSYCPNCGSPIHTWNDEDGNPIRGWMPYWKKMGKSEPY